MLSVCKLMTYIFLGGSKNEKPSCFMFFLVNSYFFFRLYVKPSFFPMFIVEGFTFKVDRRTNGGSVGETIGSRGSLVFMDRLMS